jgi:hypothetical protein
MPIIQGADLTSVSTTREPFPAGEYTVTVKESELQNNKSLIIKSRIDAAEDESFVGREYWDFINIVQNDGKQNRIGLETCKKYLEAVFGKGSPEAEASPPDTDVLNGHQVKLVLGIREYKKEGETEMTRNNQTKRIFAA